LFGAVLAGDAIGVKATIATGADINAYDANGYHALNLAALYAHTEVVRILLAAGAAVHADNDIALHCAAANGHVGVVHLLLDARADVHALNDAALREAASRGNTEIVRLLIATGADAHATNDAALREAIGCGRSETACLLLAAAADIRANSDEALCRVAANGHTEVVRLLLTAGADPSVAWPTTTRDPRDRMETALDLCANVMNPEQIVALLDASAPNELMALRAVVESAQKHPAMRR